MWPNLPIVLNECRCSIPAVVVRNQHRPLQNDMRRSKQVTGKRIPSIGSAGRTKLRARLCTAEIPPSAGCSKEWNDVKKRVCEVDADFPVHRAASQIHDVHNV